MAPMPTLAPTHAEVEPTNAPVADPVDPPAPTCRPAAEVDPEEKPEACGDDEVLPPCWEERYCGVDVNDPQNPEECPLVNIFEDDDEKDCDGYIVALFAPWCNPCKAMMEQMLALTKEDACNKDSNKICMRAILYDKKGGDYSDIFELLTPEERTEAEEKIKIFRTDKEYKGQNNWIFGSNFYNTVGKDDFLLFDSKQRLVTYVDFMETLGLGVQNGQNLDKWKIAELCDAVPTCPEPENPTTCNPGDCG